MSPYSAIVLGSTGAVGRELVAELVSSSNCNRVVAVTRRQVPQDQWGKAFPSMDVSAASSKLEIRPIDFEEMDASIVSDKFDAAFSCFGTTRADAGGAENFRKIDFGYNIRFAELVKTYQIPYFGLLSSTGAKSSSWFLYPQCKGELEDKVKDLGFARTSIFQPGLLQRGEKVRTVEKIGQYILPSVSVRSVAKAMVADYEKQSEAGVTVWSMADLQKH